MVLADDLRGTLGGSGRTGVVLGPLGRSPVVETWLREHTGVAAGDVFDALPLPSERFDRLIDVRTQDRHAVRAWFADIFSDVPIVHALAPAGALVEEALDLGIESAYDLTFVATRSLKNLESELMATGGKQFFDFARVLALAYPRRVQVGDEWVQLANRLGAAHLSVADLSMTLSECANAFAFAVDEDGNVTAEFASPAVLHAVAARVKISTSEHYAMFRALRDMAVHSLLRNDAGDRFVASELPLQALASESVEELCDDGMALLAADPVVLIQVVEDPSSPVSQGAKLVLRAAHRLGAADTLSQLELAARRSSMVRLADQIADGSPSRQWDPLWATSQPVNTNRVLHTASANVLCLASHPAPDIQVQFAGLSDGVVVAIPRYGRAQVIWRPEGNASEVRSMATLVVGGDALVFTGHSDQSVRAFDLAANTTRWVETETMDGPLSAVAAANTELGPVVAAGGVDGLLALYDPTDHALRVPPVLLGAEIRDIVFAAGVVLACLVDGDVAAVDLSTGKVIWRVAVPGDAEVCNALGAITTANGIDICVGTSNGGLYRVQMQNIRDEPEFALMAQLGSSVNAIALRELHGEVCIVAALANASWVKNIGLSDDWRTYQGHVGAVNAILVGADGHVVTGGGEGVVRSWIPRFVDSESVTLAWGVRHRGPVTGINIDLAGTSGDFTQITAGADGSVRVWNGPSDTSGARIADHDSPARALMWDSQAETAFVGYADGALRTIQRAGRDWQTRLIGIQHDGIRGLALAPNGRLYSAGVDGTVTVWPRTLTASGSITRQVSEFGQVSAIGWLNQAIVVGGQDGKVRLLNPDSLEEIASVDLGATILCLDTSGADLFVGLDNGNVLVRADFDRGVAPTAREINAHRGEVRGIQSFELGGNLVIASTGLDRRLVITDLRTDQCLADIALDGFGLGLHANPPYLAVSTTSGAMIIRLSNELPGFLGTPKPLKPAKEQAAD